MGGGKEEPDRCRNSNFAVAGTSATLICVAQEEGCSAGSHQVKERSGQEGSGIGEATCTGLI